MVIGNINGGHCMAKVFPAEAGEDFKSWSGNCTYLKVPEQLEVYALAGTFAEYIDDGLELCEIVDCMQVDPHSISSTDAALMGKDWIDHADETFMQVKRHWEEIVFEAEYLIQARDLEGLCRQKHPSFEGCLFWG